MHKLMYATQPSFKNTESKESGFSDFGVGMYREGDKRCRHCKHIISRKQSRVALSRVKWLVGLRIAELDWPTLICNTLFNKDAIKEMVRMLGPVAVYVFHIFKAVICPCLDLTKKFKVDCKISYFVFGILSVQLSWTWWNDIPAIESSAKDVQESGDYFSFIFILKRLS